MAELSSVFTQTAMGVRNLGKTFKNNAAYLKSWSKALNRNDPDAFAAAKRDILNSISSASQISDMVTKPYFERHPQVGLDPNIEKLEYSKDADKFEKSGYRQQECPSQQSVRDVMNDCRKAESAISQECERDAISADKSDI